MDFGNKGLSTMQKVLIIVGIVILIVSAIVAVFFYNQYQALKKNPNAESQAEAKKLVEQIQPFYDLPTDESPTIATVSDKSKVIDQPFFAKAENGDKILIYRKNKLALLFRPSQKKLINVGPIDLDAATGAATEGGATTSAKVSLLNSGTAAGLTTTAEGKLKAASYAGSITIAEKKNSTTKTTGRIVVVDVTGKNAALASQIASTLGGTVGSLPAGEPTPSSDIAVFLGK